MHQVLNGQPDFAQQRTALEGLMELAGDMAIMLPKMHPELNPIESFWAAMKAYCRSSLPMEAAACARMQPQPSMPPAFRMRASLRVCCGMSADTCFA